MALSYDNTPPEPTDVAPNVDASCDTRVSHCPLVPRPPLASQDGMTAIMYAAEGGHLEAIKALAAMGADPTAVDKVRAPVEA